MRLSRTRINLEVGGTVRPPPSPSPAPAQTALPGIGVSEADWNRSHKPDTQKQAGAAYNLQPSGTDDYASIGRQGGYIDGYQIQPDPSVSRDAALVAIRRELPSDALLVLDAKFGACEKVHYQSASVTANPRRRGTTNLPMRRRRWTYTSTLPA